MWNQIFIDETNHNQRFDRFLRKYFKDQPHITLADIYRAIRNKSVVVNGKKAAEEYRLEDGDTVMIKDNAFKEASDPSLASRPKKESRQLPIDKAYVRSLILFEDDNWIVFNKPTGISVHPSDNDHKQRSMHDLLRAYIPAKDGATFNASFGYRLDKETSGVLIAAKTHDAIQYINEIIRDRDIKKQYLALVVGKTPATLHIDKPLAKTFNKGFQRGVTKIDKEEGKESITEAVCERSFVHPVLGPLSLLKVTILTGRMHQIRAHLASEGFPVLGDLVYGNPKTNRILLKTLKIKKVFLHCWEYSFWDIFWEKKRNFLAPLPEWFDEITRK